MSRAEDQFEDKGLPTLMKRFGDEVAYQSATLGALTLTAIVREISEEETSPADVVGTRARRRQRRPLVVTIATEDLAEVNGDGQDTITWRGREYTVASRPKRGAGRWKLRCE